MRPSGDVQAVRRPVALIALAVGAYAVLAVLAYWPVMPFDASRLPHPAGAGVGDPAQMSWFLAWTPFALGHGLNPFFTNYIDFPLGANLASNTSVPLLGLLAAPVTFALGPVASFNLLMRLALASSATSMFLVSRRWVSWWPAAFAAGLLYGFGSYMTFESSVHLDLAFMAIPPLLFWCFDELFVTRRRSAVKVGVLLGLLGAAQLLIDPEILAYCTVMAVIGLIFLALHAQAPCPGRHSGSSARAIDGGRLLRGDRRLSDRVLPRGATPHRARDSTGWGDRRLPRRSCEAAPALLAGAHQPIRLPGRSPAHRPRCAGRVVAQARDRAFRGRVRVHCVPALLGSPPDRRRPHVGSLAPRSPLRARPGPRRPRAGQDLRHRDALSGRRPGRGSRPYEDLDPRARPPLCRLLGGFPPAAVGPFANPGSDRTPICTPLSCSPWWWWPSSRSWIGCL